MKTNNVKRTLGLIIAVIAIVLGFIFNDTTLPLYGFVYLLHQHQNIRIDKVLDNTYRQSVDYDESREPDFAQYKNSSFFKKK